MYAYLAETVVVKLTQSLTKVSGVDPVTSSHCARVVPPTKRAKMGLWSSAIRKPSFL